MAEPQELARAIGQRARKKLNDAEANVDATRFPPDSASYLRAFDHAVAAIQAAVYRLDRDLKGVVRGRERRHLRDAAEAWLKERRKFAQEDELLDWAEKARHEDTHGGENPAALRQMGYDAAFLQTDDFDPPTPDASFVIGPDGPNWIINRGTVDEERIPARPRANSRSDKAPNRVWMGIPVMPKSHRGQPLGDLKAEDLLQLAIDHWRDVVREAMTLWGLDARLEAPTSDA